MNGIIILDKPRDYTSFDAVAAMRRLCGEKKIGHTGTLDPMATGVLPLLLGKATRAASLIDDGGKEYEASFQLGVGTDTQDSTGKITAESGMRVTREQLLEALPAFRGDIFQVPPMYSAVHKDGQRLYELARRGIVVEREKRPVTVYRLELIGYDEEARAGLLTVACSKGTYIRTLCADLGEALGVYGVMTGLRRTRASGFSLAEAVTLDRARELAEAGGLGSLVLPVDRLFREDPAVFVSGPQSVRFCNGGGLDLARVTLPQQAAAGARLRVYSPQKSFLGLGTVDPEKGELAVLRLFQE